MKKLFSLSVVLLLFITTDLTAQKRKKSNKDEDKKEEKVNLGDLKFRAVGPAFLSGRIADIAVHPHDNDTWYVAVGSGGVWKTENSGTTWKPIFDKEKSYSTGAITIDPQNSNIIWVGTGENVGGRHVAYGDGVYKSEDGGNSWKNMGLKDSEHISEIIVHPENSDVLWVASQGPLWSKGGERGLFKSTDGGETWNKVLGGNEWTGVTDIMMDPRDPDRLYAATWQRHRTVAAFMGGGPGSGLHRSDDGGETWTELTNGISESNLGKIGIAISPQQPDVVYAAIELDQLEGGVFRSEDRGASWEKMSNTVSGATGPHYYQELYASPHEFDRLYLMNVRILTSGDGGKTFFQLKEEDKHSDNHALIFRDDDPDYLLVGTDAGIYESFDNAETWSYFKNLPLTQFYKVAVNNAEPFYHIFGGTQDNGSVGGPSRTAEEDGIANRHWYKTLFADGHQSATDPVYDNIIYAETQQGGLHRVDLKTMEKVFIQPQSDYGEDFERFNWDAPILVSPHEPSRLYFASQRVWKSENRGDSWEPISGDLTRDEERIELPIMGKKQSYDNPWDVNAMSNYNTITSLAESPLKEGLIYAGTDDGFIQVTEDMGGNWNKIPVTAMGLPERSFVNDIKAGLHDENTVFAVLDNHKEGDFSSYVYKSTNKGKSWTSLRGNLPNELILWRIVQDPKDENLLFLAAENGIYTSWDGGSYWQKIPGTPTISFRDLTIQKRENDLVGASFGRGFFVLDDYRALREISEETLAEEGHLFPIRKAYWYEPQSSVGNTGADFYLAENPAFGATITYYLKNKYTSMAEERKEKEKVLEEEGANIPFPGWEKLEAERLEEGRKIWILIKDSTGKVIKRVEGKGEKGINRVAWDLSLADKRPLDPSEEERDDYGYKVVPGTYSATLVSVEKGEQKILAGPESFEVVPLQDGVLEGSSKEEIQAFTNEFQTFVSKYREMDYALNQAKETLTSMKKSLETVPGDTGSMRQELFQLEKEIQEIEGKLNGNQARSKIGERNEPNIASFMRVGFRALNSSYGPTEMHKKSLKTAQRMYNDLEDDLQDIVNEEIPELKKDLEEAGAAPILNEKFGM